MATIRKKHRAPVPVFQRDPGPWSRLLIDWLATLAVIMIFGLVMLFSASYTTGYLRMGDSFHYIKQQALCMILGLGCMFLISYVDHRFLRKMVVPGYFIVLAMLAVTLTMAPLNGCRRWIRFAGLTLQSSEVAKFEMILFSSHLAAKAPQVERLDPERRILLTPREWLRVRVWKQLVVPVLPLIPVVILLAMEPHMSGIVLTVAVVGTILLLSGSGGCHHGGHPAGDPALPCGLYPLPAKAFGRLDAGSEPDDRPDRAEPLCYRLRRTEGAGAGQQRGKAALAAGKHQRLHFQRGVRGTGLHWRSAHHRAVRAVHRAGASHRL